MTVSLMRQDAYTKQYIGLSTDTKPTQEASSLKDGVNNGDTFFVADEGKTYIFCDGDWYDMATGDKDSA